MKITALDPTHAATAARLHIAGQPDTFLTSLGPAVLTTFYRALPQSPTGFGYAAITDSLPSSSPRTTRDAPPVVGFISATTSTSRLFLELSTRHLPGFVPPLLRQFARRPGLLLNCIQTAFYPLLQSATKGTPPTTDSAADSAAGAPAELLSIMVDPTWRSQGIGAHLLERLVDECRTRQITALDVTVAVANQGAQRFYARHGFVHHSNFQLYGRPMYSYRLRLGTTAQQSQ